MGRGFQAYLLIAVLSLSASANLAAMLAGNSAGVGVCPPGCCGKADCPMQAHKGSMPMKCPMNSMAGHHHQAMKCTCAVSHQEAPAVPASLFELRYDLPREHELLMPVPTAYRGAETSADSLDGFIPLPDQPPRALHS
jgi:hypothetical protein